MEIVWTKRGNLHYIFNVIVDLVAGLARSWAFSKVSERFLRMRTMCRDLPAPGVEEQSISTPVPDMWIKYPWPPNLLLKPLIRASAPAGWSDEAISDVREIH